MQIKDNLKTNSTGDKLITSDTCLVCYEIKTTAGCKCDREKTIKGSFIKDALKRNQELVNTLAHEIKYICDEAVDHNHSWNGFKQSLLNRIAIEESFKNSLGG